MIILYDMISILMSSYDVDETPLQQTLIDCHAQVTWQLMHCKHKVISTIQLSVLKCRFPSSTFLNIFGYCLNSNSLCNVMIEIIP